MPCSCGHVSCLCGVPCLCDALKCKCEECYMAVGRLCNMCNKPLYYEHLTLRQTSVEEVCDCFLVKSEISNKTEENPATELVTEAPLNLTVNSSLRLSENNVIEKPEQQNVSNPEFSKTTGNTTFDNCTEQLVPNTSIQFMEPVTTSSHCPFPFGHSQQVSMPMQKINIPVTIPNNCYDAMVFEQIPHSIQVCNVRLPRAFPRSASGSYRSTEQNSESSYKDFENIYSNHIPRNSFSTNPNSTKLEWNGATLKWLENLPDVELPKDYVTTVISKKD